MSNDKTGEHPTLSEYMPFTRRPGQSATLVPARIIEALIVAVITALLTALATVWATQKVLETRLENLESSLRRIEAEQQRMRGDLYRPRFNDGRLLSERFPWNDEEK